MALVAFDLASLSSGRNCADALLASGRTFDVIVAISGVMAGPFQLTVDGFETQFATNYLGHFFLVNRLVSSLAIVSLAGHGGADVDLNAPTSNACRTAAVHPGAVLKETTRRLIEAQPSAASAFTWKTVARGAATPVWAGFVASANDVGGRYCEDCRMAPVDDDPNAWSGVRSYALDPERAEALWRKIEPTVEAS